MKYYPRMAAVVGAGALLVALANAAPPGPKPGTQKTGYDIKAEDIRTTGPEGSPRNAPIFVFKNVGQKTIERPLKFRYWTDGTLIASTGIDINLKPGFSQTYSPTPADESFAKFGNTVEVLIDSDHELREDDEANNRLTKTLKLQFVPRRNRP